MDTRWKEKYLVIEISHVLEPKTNRRYCIYNKQCENVYSDPKQHSIIMLGHISNWEFINLCSIFIPYLYLTACHCHIFADLHLPVRRSMRLYATRITKAASDVAAGRCGDRRRCNLQEVGAPHPSYHHRPQQAVAEAQQEGGVIKAVHGYKDAITLGNDCGSLGATHRHTHAQLHTSRQLHNDCFVLHQYKN